jgi:peptide/nickel transport system substrate-binding protein
MKKLIILAIVVITVTILLWPASPSLHNKLTLSGPFEFKSQDVSKDGFLFSRLQVVETLVGIDEKAEPYPLLAQQWQLSADKLLWTFSTRDKVNFHDGSELTAQAVAKSLNLALTKPGVLRQVPILSIQAKENDVLISLSEPYRPLLQVLAHYSTAIVSEHSYDDQNHVTQLYGTGPYQIRELQAPHKATVIRYSDY